MLSGGFGGGGGGATGACPPKIGSTMCCCFSILLLECLKDKAQIARESIKTALKLPGPLGRPWTPAEREFIPRS